MPSSAHPAMRSSTPPRHRNISSCRSSSMAYARTSSLLSKDATLRLQSQQTTQNVQCFHPATIYLTKFSLPAPYRLLRAPKPCPHSACCLRKLRYLRRKMAHTRRERICKEQQNAAFNKSNVQHRPSSHERPRRPTGTLHNVFVFPFLSRQKLREGRSWPSVLPHRPHRAARTGSSPPDTSETSMSPIRRCLNVSSRNTLEALVVGPREV